jgi:outer membrane protein
MNFLRGFLVALGMCLVGYTGLAQEKKETVPAKSDTLRLSLAQAQQYAMQNNRSILNANLDIEMAKKKVWETTAMGLPQANSTVSTQYILTMPGFYKQFIAPNFIGRPDSAERVKKALDDMRFSGTLDIQVSQLIFSGSYIVGLQASKVYNSLSELNKVKSVQDIMESVSNTYFSVLIARENMIILDSTRLNLEKTLAQFTQMKTQGFVEETDVDQIQITLTNIKSSLDMIRRQADIAEKLLKVLLGIDFDQQIALTDLLPNLIKSTTYDQLLLANFTLDNNVNYQMLNAQVKSNALILKLRKSECLPEIAAFYQHEENLNSKSISFTPPDLIGVKATIPIFASGTRYARIKQAKLDLQKSINNKEETGNNLKVQFYLSKSTLVSARDKYESDKSNLELANKIYKRALIKFQNGVISTIDLTQLQNQFLNAQATYYQSLQSLISEKNNLEKLLTKSTYSN